MDDELALLDTMGNTGRSTNRKQAEEEETKRMEEKEATEIEMPQWNDRISEPRFGRNRSRSKRSLFPKHMQKFGKSGDADVDGLLSMEPDAAVAPKETLMFEHEDDFMADDEDREDRERRRETKRRKKRDGDRPKKRGKRRDRDRDRSCSRGCK